MWWQYLLLVVALILLSLNCKTQHTYKCSHYDITDERTRIGVFIGGLIAFLLNCVCAWYVIDFIINGF